MIVSLIPVPCNTTRGPYAWYADVLNPGAKENWGYLLQLGHYVLKEILVMLKIEIQND